MPRYKRFTIENGVYHILARGNNRQAVFLSEDDYRKFINLVKRCKEKFSFKVYHYVLMPNHYHLILESPDGKSLANGMKSLNVNYVVWFRKKYGGVGHFWQDRFKSFIIERGSYLLECGRYIENNPARAGLVSKAGDYEFSSYGSYVFGIKGGLVDFSPECLGLSEDEGIRGKLYSEFVAEGLKERRRLSRYFREGCYGSTTFLKNLKKEGLKTKNYETRPRKE